MAKGNENWDYLPGGKVRDKKTGAVGVIRMVGGRRVFIKDGQSLSEAMIQSGKFKGQKTKPGMRESYREEKDKDKEEVKKLRDEYEKDTKNDEKLKAYLDKQDEYLDKYEEYKDKTELKRETEPLREDYRNKQFEERQKEAVDKLNKNAEDGVLHDIKDFLSGRGDYDGSQEDFINDLSKEWQVDKDRVEDLYKEQTEKYGSRNFKPDRTQRDKSEFAEDGYHYKYDEEIDLTTPQGETDYANETDKEKRLKNVYMMDRVLRGMNNEDALDDSWLFYVEDEATDDGYDEFKKYNEDNDVYVSDEDYNRIVKMYKNRVKEYAKDGVISRDFYEDRDGNWKDYAGLDDEEIDFLSKDVKDFTIYGKGDRKTTYSKYKNKEGSDTPQRELSNFERAKQKKEQLEQEVKDLENSWLTHYNESNFNDENWRKKSDELMNARNSKREEFDKAFKDYINQADDKDLSWQDKVRKNDIQQEEELAKLKEKQNSPEYMFHRDKWEKDYYGTFEKYEKENAKIKEENAKPEDLYEPISSYYSFNKKRHEFSGDKMNDDGSVAEWGDKKFTGKGYTNDEFMEHLEDANWHTERRMLETAGLTNQELSYIKDKVTLDSYGADLDRDKTQKLIDEAKAKFRGNKSTNDYKVKSGNPIESMANDRIKEKQNTLNNDKMILSEMKKRGMKTFGADGMTQEEIEARIKKNEDYIKTATSPQNTNFSMNDAIREKASKQSTNISPFESKRVAEEDIKEKGYQYFSTHGVGPGTLPKDVKALETDDKLSGGWTTFKTDRPLSQEELSKYDIQPETRNEELKEKYKVDKSTNDTMNDAIRKKASQVKVKGDSNVIPRDFTEGTINFKREGEDKTETYKIKKDEYGRYIGTDASGKEYQFPIGILRNHNVVEFVNSSDTPKTSSNEYMNSKIRKGAGVKDAYKNYLKEHKDSNITFEQFKKIYNK